MRENAIYHLGLKLHLSKFNSVKKDMKDVEDIIKVIINF